MENAVTVAGVFFAITLPIYVVGWLLTSYGRRSDAFGRNRHLVLGILTIPFARLLPITQAQLARLRHTVLQAGHYHRRAAEEFLGLRNATLTAVFVLSSIWLSYQSRNPATFEPHVLLCLSVFVAVYTLPVIALHSLAKSRSQRIQYALPDAVDMINMLIAGGTPLQKAIHRTSAEMETIHKDLAMELAVLHHQAATGSMEIALRQFADRVDQPDVISLSTITRHADRLGGSVQPAFQDYADSIRRQRRQRAEERGNKASVKLLFPVIMFLAPSVYMLLLGPAALELRDFMANGNKGGNGLVQNPDAAEIRELFNQTSR